MGVGGHCVWYVFIRCSIDRPCNVGICCVFAVSLADRGICSLLSVLLCGCLPFDDDSAAISNDELVKLKFQLRYPRWAKNLSKSSKDLLSHLLDVNPHTRYSAEEALEHPWVRGDTAPRNNLLASPGRIKKSPVLMGSARGGARYSGGRRKKRDVVGQNRSPPTPTSRSGPIMRKTSI